ncbi:MULTISPECIES: HD domain-containing phosphohydrolase [Pseudomonas]|uniref:HD domain-containing phosphohydrolase n=1 Tax=Pseudomonas TaxID=286 RepID=UPI0018C88660|nr:hypothetical protein [Pseudomonas putida]
MAPQIAYCHHEEWDGTGYPRVLSGEQIPLEARPVPESARLGRRGNTALRQ